MRSPAQPDTATAKDASARKHPEVNRQDELVWPPPAEDLRAFTVVKIGEGDEQAESLLIVAGLSAKAASAPSPPVATPAPARRAASPAPATERNVRPAPTRPAGKPRATASRVVVFRPPPASPRMQPRWLWLAPVLAAFSGRTGR
jgi:hypothetical protein